jgi:hypothetical protein
MVENIVSLSLLLPNLSNHCWLLSKANQHWNRFDKNRNKIHDGKKSCVFSHSY